MLVLNLRSRRLHILSVDFKSPFSADVVWKHNPIKRLGTQRECKASYATRMVATMPASFFVASKFKRNYYGSDFHRKGGKSAEVFFEIPFSALIPSLW